MLSLLSAPPYLDEAFAALRKRFSPFLSENPNPRPEKARKTAECSSAPLARTPTAVYDAHHPHHLHVPSSASSIHNLNSRTIPLTPGSVSSSGATVGGRRPRRDSVKSQSGVNKQTTGPSTSRYGDRQDAHQSLRHRRVAPLRRHDSVIFIPRNTPSPPPPPSAPAPPALSGASTIFYSPVAVATHSSSTPSPCPAPAPTPRAHPLLRRTLNSPGPRPAHVSPPNAPQLPTPTNPYPINPPKRTRPFVPLCSPSDRVHFPRAQTAKPDYRRHALRQCMKEREEGKKILLLGAHKGVMVCMAERARQRSVADLTATAAAAAAGGDEDVEMSDDSDSDSGSSDSSSSSPHSSVSSSTTASLTKSWVEVRQVTPMPGGSEDWEMVDV